MFSPRLPLSVACWTLISAGFVLGQAPPFAQSIDQAIAKDEPRVATLA